MLNEEKLRAKLAKILESPTYRGLHTFARDPLIDDIIKAVKGCEEEAEAKTVKGKIKRILKSK